MKKCYFLIVLLISSISFAQTPMITAIIDGDCAGGTPKLLEIFAQGTVDFSAFALENQTNANTTWGNTTELSSFGTVTNDFVYITTSTSDEAFESEFPSAGSSPVLVSGVMNLNGDDRIRLIELATTAVIDQYGEEGIDGTATAWEYKDSYAKRVNGTLPDGTFTASSWGIAGVSALNGLGICQNGTETFETIMGGIGNYDIVLSNSTFNTPAFSIHPNPAKDVVIIKMESDGDVVVSIYDVMGKLVMPKTKTSQRLDVSSLNKGIYVINLEQKNVSVTRKLVIQ